MKARALALGLAIRALALVLGAAAVASLGACRSSPFDGFDAYTERPGPYDRFTDLQLEALSRAADLHAAGELEVARRYLTSLAAAAPDNLVVAARLQEVELELLAAGLPVPDVAPAGKGLDPVAGLRPLYERRARSEGTAYAYVLAARLASEETLALGMLAAALERDPDCVWAHYGLAWNHARAHRHPEARAALARALELDPGHPPSRRLEAALLARAGDVERAVRAYRAWLERHAGDPRVTPASVADTRLDLASLYVLDGDSEAALATLEEIDAMAVADPTGIALVRSTALQMQGRTSEALAEARSAAAAAPLDARPWLHEAILLSEHANDPEGARAAWQEVLRVLEQPGASSRGPRADPGHELAALLMQLQARTALARLEAKSEPVEEPR